MRYRITCLTPTLIGDGQKLSPIDYMVWKDHVNVLDQRRIFKLLSKGPRLDGYLAQLKKADRLDFASWGGFAQNFAGRRIPFENVSAIPHWEKATAGKSIDPDLRHLAAPVLIYQAPRSKEHCAPAPFPIAGPKARCAIYRSACYQKTVCRAIPHCELKKQCSAESGSSRMKRFAAGDSNAVTHAGMKVYLLRVSTLIPKGGGKYELGWKSQRGSVNAQRVAESTPLLVRDGLPGHVF